LVHWVLLRHKKKESEIEIELITLVFYVVGPLFGFYSGRTVLSCDLPKLRLEHSLRRKVQPG
jgi:hypothetical protein